MKRILLPLLLVASLLVEQRDQVAPVVHGHLRADVGDRVEMRVVRVAVLAATGERADPVLRDEGRGHVVLGGQRVGCREHDLRAAGLDLVRACAMKEESSAYWVAV